MKRPRITVHNRQRRIAIERGQLQSFAERALQLCPAEVLTRLARLVEIDVVLVSDRRMTRLHHQFMGIEGPTDVITFQHGEIVVSVETAKRQARSYRTTIGHELRLYLVHGLLHLAGYHDDASGERRTMERLQERIVALASS